MKQSSDIRRYELKGLSIFLIPEEHRKPIKDPGWPDRNLCNMVQEWRSSLVIFHEEEKTEQHEIGTITQVELHGPVSWEKYYDTLVRSQNLQYDFNMRGVPRKYASVFGAEPWEKDYADWNTLLHQLLELCLVEGRPVRSFKTTFLFPFTIRKDEHSPAEKPRFRAENLRLMKVGTGDAETVVYFLPHIRDILFARDADGKIVSDKGVEPIYRYELINKAYTLHVERDGEKLPLDVDHIRFYLFPNNNICFLSYSVTLTDMDEVDWDAIEEPLDFLNALIQEDGSERIGKFQAHTCLAVNNLARIVYPTYREQVEENKIADLELVRVKDNQVLARFDKMRPAQDLGEDLRPRLSPVITSLVKEGINIGDGSILPMLDDRMFVNSHIALWGRKPESDAGREAYQAFFSVALYVDIEGEEHLGGYAYDPEFVKNQMEQEVLWRWYAHSGNLYGFTNYSNIYMGFGRFLANIASRHIHAHYFYMALLALYYRTSMIDYSAQLARATKGLLAHPDKEECRTRIRKLRESFIEFTNQYWFYEITSQMQGIETFEYQCRSMYIEKAYRELKEEIERADGFIQMAWQDEVSKQARWIAGIGLCFAVISPLVSWFAISGDVFNVREIISRSGFYLVFIFGAGLFGAALSSVIIMQKSLLGKNPALRWRSVYAKVKETVRQGNYLEIIRSKLNALKK